MYPYDQDNHQMYEQYAQAHESGNHEGIDPNQAYGHVQQFMQQAPPEMQQQVYQQHFQQMPYDQRQQFAQQLPPPYQQQMDPNNPQQMGQGFYQMGQQQPGLVQQLLGGAGGGGSQGGPGGPGGPGGGMGGLLSNPMAKAALVGIAGLAAKQLLGGHHGGGGGLGGVLGGGGGLGGLLGGGQGYGRGDRDDRGEGWGGDRDERGDNGGDGD